MDTLSVKLVLPSGHVSYLGWDYEGEYRYPAFVDFCSASEFTSMAEAFDDADEAAFKGLRFTRFELV